MASSSFKPEASVAKIKSNIKTIAERGAQQPILNETYSYSKSILIKKEAENFRNSAADEIREMKLDPDAEKNFLDENKRICDALDSELEKSFNQLVDPKEEKWNKKSVEGAIEKAKAEIKAIATTASLGSSADEKTLEAFCKTREEKLDNIKTEGLQNEIKSLEGSTSRTNQTKAMLQVGLSVYKDQRQEAAYAEEIEKHMGVLRRAENALKIDLGVKRDDKIAKAIFHAFDAEQRNKKNKKTTAEGQGGDAQWVEELNELMTSKSQYFESESYKDMLYEKVGEGGIKIAGIKDSKNPSLDYQNISSRWFYNEEAYRTAARGQVELFQQIFGVGPGSEVELKYSDPKIFQKDYQIQKILDLLTVVKEKNLYGKLDPEMVMHLKELKKHNKHVKLIDKIFALQDAMKAQLKNTGDISKEYEGMTESVTKAKTSVTTDDKITEEFKKLADSQVLANPPVVASMSAKELREEAERQKQAHATSKLDADFVLSDTDKAKYKAATDDTAKFNMIEEQLKALHERIEKTTDARKLVTTQIEKMEGWLHNEASPAADMHSFAGHGPQFERQLQELKALQAENSKEVTNLEIRTKAWANELKNWAEQEPGMGEPLNKNITDARQKLDEGLGELATSKKNFKANEDKRFEEFQKAITNAQHTADHVRVKPR